ncbi:MAG: Ldh family oxidoreductase [Spirochaetia bacterium]
MSTRISAAGLGRFVKEVLGAKGVPQEDAGIVSDCLVSANLSGIDTHGVVRLAHYIDRLDRGSIKARPDITVTRSSPSVLVVDADDGLGHVAAYRAAEAAVETCREQGSVTAIVKNSSHFGPAGHFLREPLKQGIAGMVMTNTNSIVVPHGAAEPFFGTNPIAIGFPGPAEEAPFLYDASTSTIAYGNVELAKVEGRPIPDHWALDAQGRPTTDPNAVVGMRPMADHKGSALGLCVDIMCALFTGMPFGPHINHMYSELDEPRKLGHFMTFWDVEHFVGRDAFGERMRALVGELQNLTRAEGTQRIYYPGEPEAECRAERSAKGIPVEQGLLNQLGGLGTRFGVDAPPAAEEN